ncbi:serine/threonine-protein phosphatase PGAM5, mitochondrial isoform X2 [Narcine bancroftii]|uniref:serine/threonine-protein phosphatase PGAM5, mitochondrial isoform X2 n=1 Tax=Narcine bancroftii TaxID=1343680 RepID=UPI003831ABB2
MAFRKAFQVACGIAGTAAVVVAAAATQRRGDGRVKAAAAVSWSPGTGGWDSNWDKREPVSRIKPNQKNKEASEDVTTQLENYKAKATRHIFLIRHSQYDLTATTDKDRVLTSLGREQAELTGQRLASLGLNYDILIHSSMTRAKETAAIIRKYLPGLEMMSCDLLREGAPIEPDPPVSHWKPEAMYHEDGARIEAAFRRYIHRADSKQQNDSYEIIVCHANVIRYFVCSYTQNFGEDGRKYSASEAPWSSFDHCSCLNVMMLEELVDATSLQVSPYPCLSSPVPSRRMAENVSQQWQHHLAHYPSKWEGCTSNVRRHRLHAS